MPWTTAQKNPEYGRAAWRRAREQCLRAANWRCQIQLDGCQGAASEVDHIKGLAQDPDHLHLRAACTSCHRKITAQQGGGYRRPKTDPPARPATTW